MFRWRLLPVVWLLTSATCGGPLAAQNERDKLPENLQRFDRNQDNKISQREMPRKLRTAAFPKHDKDQDGALDRRELISFLQTRKKKTPANRSTGSVTSVKVKRVLNLQYASTPSHRPAFGSLDLYLPQTGQNFPVLFFVHGGALVKGDKSSLAANAVRFVEQGYAVVAVNYRLSPAVKFPAHIEDVAQGFAWAHKNIGKYGGDQKRIFVAGGSAGGYLATLLTLDARYLRKHDLDPSIIVGTISISGLMNTEPVPAELKGNRKIAAPLACLDVLPTLMRYAGVTDHGGKPLDGLDVSKVLSGEQAGLKRDLFFYHGQAGPQNEEIALTTPEWKLIIHGRDIRQEVADGREIFLFRIADDPLEKTNVAREHPQVVRQLRERLVSFRKLQPPDPVPVYSGGKIGFQAPKHWEVKGPPR